MSKAVKKKKTLEELLEEALVPEEEQPYEVPENWVWVYLNQVVKDIQYGYTDTAIYEKVGPKFLRITDIQDENVDWKKVPYCKIDEKQKEKYKLESGDIVVARTGATTGKSYLIKDPPDAIFASYLIRIRTKKPLSPEYIWMFMRSPEYWKQIMVVKKGSAQPGANAKILGKLKLPLPPINEQIRMAEKVEHLLDKIDEAKQLIKEVKDTIDIRREAILDKAMRGELTSNWRKENPSVESAEILINKIEKERKSNSKKTAYTTKITKIPYELPKGWKWVRLSQILDVNPPKEKLDLPDNQICSFVPMASVSDVTGKIEKVEERYFSTVKKGYTFFKNGDIIFAKITPCMENGKSAIVEGMKNGFGFGSTEFFVLRVSEHVNKKLIHFLIRSKRFRAEAKNVMSGAVGQQRVPKNFIEEYLFPLPPKAEQEKIVSILDSIFDNEDEIIEILSLESQLEILKKSILFKAFRGELGTNDPQEESALEILKEILREKLK